MMSRRIVKDIAADTCLVSDTQKIPVIDKDLSTPLKGSLLYNSPDDLLYYADGLQWLPIVSGSNVTLSDAGVIDPHESLVVSGLGPDLSVKGISAGSGISVTSSVNNNIIIQNTSPASSVTLISAGGSASLVNDGTGPALATKGLTAGAGITLTPSATDVVVSVTQDQYATNLSSSGALVGVNNFNIDITRDPTTGYVDVRLLLLTGGTTANVSTINLLGAVPVAYRPTEPILYFFTAADMQTEGTTALSVLCTQISSLGDISISRCSTNAVPPSLQIAGPNFLNSGSFNGYTQYMRWKN